MSTQTQWIADKETRPSAADVQARINRIVEYLESEPFGTPPWMRKYAFRLDNGAKVELGNHGFADKECKLHKHNGFYSYVVPAPKSAFEFNILRRARHFRLLKLAEAAISDLDAQTRPVAHNVISIAPFRWDEKYHGKAPIDEQGRLIPEQAREKLAEIRDYHGDMYYSIDAFLRSHGVDPDLRTF